MYTLKQPWPPGDWDRHFAEGFENVREWYVRNADGWGMFITREHLDELEGAAMPDKPIETREELAAAAVQAFLDGDPATRQHIVDVLGDRAQPSDAPTEGLDWS